MYCGLDVSLRGTGVCILDENGEVSYENIIRTFPKDQLEYRFAYIMDELHVVVTSKPKMVFIEDLSYGSKGRGAYQLSGIHYMVRTFILYANDMEFEVIQPTVLKQYITGKGNSNKEMMIECVNKKYGKCYRYNKTKSKSEDDLADAYGLARMCFERDTHGK